MEATDQQAGAGVRERAPGRTAGAPDAGASRTRVRRIAFRIAPLLPGLGLLALTLAFGFEAGGYFPGTPALAAVAVAVALVLHTTLAARPFEGLSVGVGVAAGALALLATWTVLSSVWSDAPTRALAEFDRALLYALVLLLFSAIGRTPRRFTWLVRGAALAFVVICIAGLVSRVAPDWFSVDYPIAPHRLSFPVTYWNAMGLCAALAIVFCAWMAASPREPRALRVAATAVIPALVATLVLTYSRGGIAATIGGLVLLLAIARPRLWPTALVAAGAPAAFAAIETSAADAISSATPTSAAAVAEGHDLAVTVIVCVLIAGALRALLLPLDERIAALRLPAQSRRTAFGGAAVLALVAAIGAAVAFDAPDRIARQYDRFVEGDTVSSSGDLTQRLKDPGNNGRIDLWNVAVDSLQVAPLHGTGAGTFPLQWERNRPIPGNVREGHSLYLEIGGELGLIGLGLVIAALAAIGIGLARRVRRPDRELYGVALAAFVTWALHAAVDWDWEMPVICVWVFALGGAALAAQPRATLAPRSPGNTARIAVAIALLVLAVTPGLMWLSQHRLDNALSAWRHGDCAQTIDYALDANRALSARPEPFVLIGYCDVRLGNPEIGVTALRNAVRRDPDNWEYHYGLALVQAVAGEDPRPEAARALRLNPKSPLAQAAVQAFRAPQDEWERRARALPLGVR